jgi:DNA processing protein
LDHPSGFCHYRPVLLKERDDNRQEKEFEMEQTQLRYWLALNLLNPVLGSRRACQLLKHFHDPQALFEAGSVAWQSIGLSELACSALSQPDWQAVDQALLWSEQPGHGILCLGQSDYPEMLSRIPDPPVLLFYQGQPGLLERQQLAMVGSRNPTPSGTETAFDLAASSAKLGFTITSGMALGIDTAAHQGALSVAGNTIGVAGTGLDRVYPSQNKGLAELIRNNGLLISEFPLGTKPLGRNFPMRNRIISGLSRGVIVVEAAMKSGSLITAKQALEQGRDVFAVPGSIHSPTSRGCHWLLRQGAKLVENIGDILEEFDLRLAQLELGFEQQETGGPVVELDSHFQQVLSKVDFVPTSVDRIIERSGLTADAVCSMLLVLELQELVHITSTGHYCRTRSRLGKVEEGNCGIYYA